MNSLAIKSLLGLLNLALIMGLVLFLSAGTIHYQQAWVYLIIFFVGVAAISIYLFLKDKRLLQSRLKIGPTAEKRKAQKWIQGIASIGFTQYIFFRVLTFVFTGQMYRSGCVFLQIYF